VFAKSALYAETYVKVGDDALGQTSFSGTYSGGGNSIGWAKQSDPTTIVKLTSEQMEGSAFIVGGGAGNNFRTPTASGTHTFSGASLSIVTNGYLNLRSGNNSTIKINQLIAVGGKVTHTIKDSAITLDAPISIQSGSELVVSFNRAEGTRRSLTVTGPLSGAKEGLSLLI
jgi:hypothetical protein